MNTNIFLTQQQQQQQQGRSPGYFVQLGAVNPAQSTATPCFVSPAYNISTQQQRPIMREEQQNRTMLTQQGFIIANNNNNNNNNNNSNNNNNNGDICDGKNSQTSLFSLMPTPASFWASPDSAASFIPNYPSSNTENVLNSSNPPAGVSRLFSLNNNNNNNNSGGGGPSTAVDTTASSVMYSFAVPQHQQQQQRQQEQQYQFQQQQQYQYHQQDAACAPETSASSASSYVILTPAAGNTSSSNNAPLYYLVNASSASPSVQQRWTTTTTTTFMQNANPHTIANNNNINRSEQLPPYPLPPPHANVMGVPWTTPFVPNSGTAPASGFPVLMRNPTPSSSSASSFNHVDGNMQLDSRSFQQQYHRQSQQLQLQQTQSQSQQLQSQQLQQLQQSQSQQLQQLQQSQSQLQQSQQQQSYYMGNNSNSSTPSALSPSSGTRRRTRCNDANNNNNNNNRNSGGVSGQDCEIRAGVPYNIDPVPIDISKTQLIVNFLPQSLTDEEFRSLFARFGPLHRKPTKIIYDQSSRRRKGFGFVYYKDGRSTEGAIKEMNGFLVGGRKLKVRYADQQRSSIDCDSCNGDEVGTTSLDDPNNNNNNNNRGDDGNDNASSHDDMLWIVQDMDVEEEN